MSRWAFAKGLVPSPTFFVDNPAELSSDRYAGLGAAWYWVVARSDINALSDRRDLDTVTRRINGGLNGLDDRRNRYNKALSLGDRLLTLITSGEEEFLSALNADEQREVLNLLRWVAAPETGELRKMFADRSMYRTTNAPTDTLAGKALTDNAFGWDQRVESSALRGEAWAIVLVAQAASGLLPGVRKADGTPDVFLVRHALSVLAEIESTNKTALQSYIDATKGKA